MEHIRNLGRQDFLTESVIHMIDDMLVVSKNRPNAEDLWRKQLRIVEIAKRMLQESQEIPSALRSGLNATGKGQPRSFTHPPPGPAPNSAPILPPVLPPGFSPPEAGISDQGLARGVQFSPVYEQSHGHDAPQMVLDETDHRQRHTPDLIEYENESLEFASVHQQTPPGFSQHVSPITPPFSPQEIHPQEVPRQPVADPFVSSMQHNPAALVDRTRNPSQTPQSTYSTYSTPGTGICSSTAWSLGHNQQNRERFRPGVNGNGNPSSCRPVSAAALDTDSLAGNVQLQIAYDPHAMNGYGASSSNYAAAGPSSPTAHFTRQSSGFVAPQLQRPQQYEQPAPPPAPTSPTSDFMLICHVLAWKRKCKLYNSYVSCLSNYNQERLKGRDHVRNSLIHRASF